MATLNSYLHFNGNAEEAFTFYKSAFGTEFAMVMRFKDVPPSEYTPKGNEGEKIMHISLPVGKNSVLMGSDIPEDRPPVTIGNHFTVSITADSKEEADRLFNGLSAGGRVTQPMEDAFWGSYFGMFKDRFGIQWMVSFDRNAAPENK